MKIGNKVQLKPSYARWYLDHPEIYASPSTGHLQHPYEKETLIHLMCCLGVPVYGMVISQGSDNCYKVIFEVDNLFMDYYVDPGHVIVVDRRKKK